MKRHNAVIVERMKLGGFNVHAEDRARSGVVQDKGAVTTLEEALEMVCKLMEDEV